MNQPDTPQVQSPCTNVCRIERRSGYCEGCRRTVEEIIAWPTATNDQKRSIIAQLPSRTVRKSRLPW